MSQTDQFERVLGDWIVSAAPRSAPADLHERSMALVREAATRRRRFTLPTFRPIVLMQAAAVVAVLVLAGTVISGGGWRSFLPNGVAAPTLPATPSTTAEPTKTAVPSLIATALASSGPTPVPPSPAPTPVPPSPAPTAAPTPAPTF